MGEGREATGQGRGRGALGGGAAEQGLEEGPHRAVIKERLQHKGRLCSFASRHPPYPGLDGSGRRHPLLTCSRL
ncbi:unnamed protein product [Ectocarpus sp. CCAP 1310/34]|nr:unnamed protein product [Ectocarpus sp. CCAP 1310/34]